MFFVRNLMFLTSLAFISWVILCYLNYVNERRDLSHRMELGLDKSLGDMPICETKYHRGYYGYIKFISVFTGIYVLARLIEMLDAYTSVRTKFDRTAETVPSEGPNMRDHNRQNDSPRSVLALNVHMATFSREDFRKVLVSLHQDIAKIWHLNRILDRRVRELEQQNLLLMGKDLLLARERTVGGNGLNYCVNPFAYFLEIGNGDNAISTMGGYPYYIRGTGDTQRHNAGPDGDHYDQSSLSGQLVRAVVPQRRNEMFSSRQNIFVAKRFLHINDETNANNGDDDECANNWQKYLKMRHSYQPLPTIAATETLWKKIDLSKIQVDFSPKLSAICETEEKSLVDVKASDKGLCNPMPLVVTTEDLENLQGFVRP